MAFKLKNEEKSRRSVFCSFTEDSAIFFNDLSLKSHFRRFGTIVQTGVQKNFAIIEFETIAAAEQCLLEPIQHFMGVKLKIKARESKARDRKQHQNDQNQG